MKSPSHPCRLCIVMAKMETMVLIGGHLPLIISVTGFVPVSA